MSCGCSFERYNTFYNRQALLLQISKQELLWSLLSGEWPVDVTTFQSGALQWSEIMMLLRQLSYAIKNQLKSPKAYCVGFFFFPFAGSLWHKGAYNCLSVHGIHLSCHNNTPKGTKCASIVRFNQWEYSTRKSRPMRVLHSEHLPAWYH